MNIEGLRRSCKSFHQSMVRAKIVTIHSIRYPNRLLKKFTIIDHIYATLYSQKSITNLSVRVGIGPGSTSRNVTDYSNCSLSMA